MRSLTLASQTLAQRLKQQRDRLQRVQQQQTSGSSRAAEEAPTAERRIKRQRSQQTDDNGHNKWPRQQRELGDSSSDRSHKKQKRTLSAQPAQQRPADTAVLTKARPQTKRVPASAQAGIHTRPARTANKVIQNGAAAADDKIQPADDDDEEYSSTYASATLPRSVVTEASNKRIKNPQVYLDMAINQQPVGRLVIELFQYASPRTVANFRALCTGERGVGSSGRALHYLNSRVHRIDPSFAIQLGDITSGDGTGGDSIYGAPTFAHEPSHRRHSGFGTVSTSAALHSVDGASSTFFISTSHTPLRWLDKRHTVFGHVVRGKQVLLDIERLAGRRKGGTPKAEVTVVGCGSMRKEQRLEEDEKRRQRHEAQTAKVKAKVELLCPRCESVGKVNKRTRKGVRVWCTSEECQYCWYEALSEWDEVKKAEFAVKEVKRREEEERKEREEAEKSAELEGEEGEDEEEDEEGEEGEEGAEDWEGEIDEADDDDVSGEDDDEDDS